MLQELLALEEHIGCVGTGLSEEFIQNNLKVRTLALLPAHNNLEASNDQQRISFCVVCQVFLLPSDHCKDFGTVFTHIVVDFVCLQFNYGKRNTICYLACMLLVDYPPKSFINCFKMRVRVIYEF